MSRAYKYRSQRQGRITDQRQRPGLPEMAARLYHADPLWEVGFTVTIHNFSGPTCHNDFQTKHLHINKFKMCQIWQNGTIMWTRIGTPKKRRFQKMDITFKISIIFSKKFITLKRSQRDLWNHAQLLLLNKKNLTTRKYKASHASNAVLT